VVKTYNPPIWQRPGQGRSVFGSESGGQTCGDG